MIRMLVSNFDLGLFVRLLPPTTILHSFTNGVEICGQISKFLYSFDKM